MSWLLTPLKWLLKRHSLEIWLSKAIPWHQQNYSTCGSIRASTNQKADSCQVYNSISQGMIQFKNSTEEFKYTSDGFILSPRWGNICSWNFKIKFTTLLQCCCVLNDWAFFAHSALETPAVYPCKNGTMCSWDTQAECQLEQPPPCSESLELRHLWSKALCVDRYFPRSALESLTEQVYSLQHRGIVSEITQLIPKAYMSTPYTGVDSCVIT